MAGRSDHQRQTLVAPGTPLKLFLVAGEHSGDALGAKLITALRDEWNGEDLELQGVGGPLMAGEGLASLFPLDEVAVMGPVAILKALPRIVRRVYQTVDAAKAFKPDVIVIIDSPEFTHPIAKRLRRALPDVPIIDYVSPSVWAWRSGRAAKMAAYIDHVLALLPFEPEAHRRLGGPACTYIGHPLIERIEWLRALDPEPLKQRLQLTSQNPVLVVLPGSRGSEIAKLMAPFGDTLCELQRLGVRPQVVLPAVRSKYDMIEELARDWPVAPHIVTGEDDKFRAFKLADAALAASGTVTLELGMSRVPMVVAYRVEKAATVVRYLLKIPSVVLANLVLGEEPFPEFLQEHCIATKMAPALLELIQETPARRRQLEALDAIPAAMASLTKHPSETAAKVVLSYIRNVE
ncbi:MAG: lipid-A-disaccharide synthase [Hyphomicrobiaceae bacterium]